MGHASTFFFIKLVGGKIVNEAVNLAALFSVFNLHVAIMLVSQPIPPDLASLFDAPVS